MPFAPRAGLNGLTDSLLAAQHVLEMFRRTPRRCEQSPYSESGPEQGKTWRLPLFVPVLEKRQHMHLSILLDKNEQGDATEEQRKQMREWVTQIKKASGG